MTDSNMQPSHQQTISYQHILVYAIIEWNITLTAVKGSPRILWVADIQPLAGELVFGTLMRTDEQGILGSPRSLPT
jgi:hypothetical protein